MADGDGTPDGARTSPLLTKREAAAFCRVSLRTFERFVQRDLPAVPIGARIFFAAEDGQRWLEDRRDCVWNRTAAATTSSARRTRAANPMSREESEILGLLRRQHPPSTPTP